MISKTIFIFGAAACVCLASGQTVKLQPVASGFMPKMGGYMPQRLALSEARPASIKKLPTGLSHAKFGVLVMATKDFSVCIGDLPDKPGQLFVDTNRNGDLTDDPVPKWNIREYKQGTSTYHMHMGSALIGIHLAGSNDSISLGAYAFDPADPQRTALKDVLLYYSDYGYQGEVSLKGKIYPILLADKLAKGDFSSSTGISLYIDTNGNGRFNESGKEYDVSKPFNIAGTTYELGKIAASGDSLNFKISSVSVPEVLPPVTYSVGKPFPGFVSHSLDKNEVSFPSGYKGHIVLLDFWATWCGPCIEEMPNVIATYQKYHDKGFDVLGVTLDQANSAQKVIDFTKEKGMTWPQIYDGKFWSAEIAVKYGINSIPQAFLVDGDTGILIAEGGSLRGEGLSKAVQEALQKKAVVKL